MEQYGRLQLINSVLLNVRIPAIGLLSIMITYAHVDAAVNNAKEPLLFDDLSCTTWFSQALNACMDAWAQMQQVDSCKKDGNTCVYCVSNGGFMRVINDLAYAHFCLEQMACSHDNRACQADVHYLKYVVSMIMDRVDKCCATVLGHERRMCIQRINRQLCISLSHAA